MKTTLNQTHDTDMSYPIAGANHCEVMQSLDALVKIPTLTHGVLVRLSDVERVFMATIAQPTQPDWLLSSTQDLAKHIARRCYPEVPQFEVLSDLAGVISQIDHMTTGMERRTPPVLQNIELYRMQMAAISGAAYGYWKLNDSILPDYDTPALRDVAALYQRYNVLYQNTV